MRDPSNVKHNGIIQISWDMLAPRPRARREKGVWNQIYKICKEILHILPNNPHVDFNIAKEMKIKSRRISNTIFRWFNIYINISQYGILENLGNIEIFKHLFSFTKCYLPYPKSSVKLILKISMKFHTCKSEIPHFREMIFRFTSDFTHFIPVEL